MYKTAHFYFLICIVLVSCNKRTIPLKNPVQEQKVLKVKEIRHDGVVDFQNISRLLDEKVETNYVDIRNWSAFPYEPKVSFKIAHSDNQIWLKWQVEEENILAERTEPNSYVFKDSCVEFFFDPMADGNYYNFETNCIGTILSAYGPQRKPREYLSADTIKNIIQVESSLGSQSFSEKTGGHTWEMLMVIPAEVLTHNPDIQLKGLKSRANFYKCGDATSKRHYLSWNPISTQKPDFHRPEFFGELIFE
ncbi:carbohydrate-binding family 9-like protein [Flagellimonas onchidii]|uniref:carbohydrate-binding family 9-like protein n=1 Tax=Flagellimonas onchidii TaxID=2562684 RepID=UPI0010A63C5B|nr:carbohydrate-binding family 9-like protein [Allomuricauda onchidii]